MDCVLDGNCVKAFGKAIHALSRIGDELWLDPMVRGLALRSVNSAHSAYACFLFSPLFFQQYNLGSVSEEGNETIKCKLVIKSVLPLFRCLSSIERNVKRCQISISAPCDRVMIRFFCRHGITKTHNVRFQESEALQAVFASHLCPNVLKAPARLLGDMVTHFPVSQEEITLSMTSLRVSLRNYFEGAKDHIKTMHTEISLHPEEFDYFQVGVDSDITFCLKELRGLLAFAESHCLPVSVHSSATGSCVVCRPVCFSVEDMVLEATVVLATLIDSEIRGPSQPTETPVPTTPRCVHAATLPVGSCEARSNIPHDITAVTELVTSSQDSPIINPPALMQLLPQTDIPNEFCVPDAACPSTSTTPASTVICSLLFRALSSDEDDDSCAAGLNVLACYSDGEETMEDYPRSFLLGEVTQDALHILTFCDVAQSRSK
uniref:Cell cycle checkpoint control protein RAD9A n=1 Tax=Amphiprion ocellaris TaxID=80972 RepID=A0AAQ5ZIB5_AMPOC